MCTNITSNPPVQPSYGDSMREALEAQVALLTGSEIGDADFTGIRDQLGLEEGSNLMEELMKRFEAPLRKTTAQIDTDVLRQTILGEKEGGGTQEVTYDDQGRIVTGNEPAPAYTIKPVIKINGGPKTNNKWKEFTPDESSAINDLLSHTSTEFGNAIVELQIVNQDGKILERVESPEKYVGHHQDRYDAIATMLKDTKLSSDLLDKAKGVNPARDPIPDLFLDNFENNINTSGSFVRTATDPPDAQRVETGKGRPIYAKDEGGQIIQDASKAGLTETVTLPIQRGTGMIDLLGDTRAVQEQTRSEDYAQYVKDNPDLEAAFAADRQQGGTRTIEEFGQEHYETYGKAEGRELAMGEYTLQDTADQAGFREGQFMGLSALAEDIGRGGQQRAREADIADVERLGGRATEAYRAQGDLSGALETARAMGAGGIDELSAIPASPLFTGTATGTLADRARAENLGITAISGGRMGDYDPLALAGQAGQAGQAGIALAGAVQPGQAALGTAQPGGTDAFRSALMQQGMGALDQGITARENRAIQEAARARATTMGRTFDQTASIREAEAVIAEDNARRMQNRAFAQRALGQEVGIQQADLTRGLQAQQLELGRQSAGVDRQLTAEEKDIERAMRRGAMEEQYRQQGLGAERASAVQMVGLEQATSADPFQAILQRQGQNNLAAGGAVFGQAGYGLDSGPQYLNPEAGLGFIQNQATNAANMYGAQIGADATRSAGMWGGIGSALGGGLSAIPWKCWVAREVYGAHNPAWLLFRNWLDTDAPRWLDKLYLAFGERFANFISNKPRLKARIRMWMDTKIGR